MPKHCLIIDDNPQEEQVEWIESKLRKKNIQAFCHQLNIGTQLRNDLLTDQMIDLEKVTHAFEDKFRGQGLDLVCIDYNLEDDKVTGLDILKQLHQLRPKVTYMIYSSNLDEVARKIIEEYEKEPEPRKLLTKIKDLARFHIKDFVAREQYAQKVVDILSKEQQSLHSIIEEKLLEQGGLVFQQGYPPFSGMTLQQVAQEIQLGTPRGHEFLREIIELAIAQAITINS